MVFEIVHVEVLYIILSWFFELNVVILPRLQEEENALAESLSEVSNTINNLTKEVQHVTTIIYVV